MIKKEMIIVTGRKTINLGAYMTFQVKTKLKVII